MAKAKKKSNEYFTQATEDAIVMYNMCPDPVLKSRIFAEEIYYPFYKLVENIIHTFKFYYTDVADIEDLKHEVVSVLVEEKIHRYDPELGYKAFSYFQTIVKRWLINYNSKNYRKLKQVGTFDETVDSYEEEIHTSMEKTVPLYNVVERFIEQSYSTMDIHFPKEQDQKIADAVLTIFKTRHDLEIFKKKALYIYIREITDCDTPALTKVVSKLKEVFKDVYNTYEKQGYVVEY